MNNSLTGILWVLALFLFHCLVVRLSIDWYSRREELASKDPPADGVARQT